MAGYVPGLGALSFSSELIAKARLTELEARLKKLEGKAADVREAACEKVRGGALLTRAEVSDYLGVSTRKIQRMEGAGIIARCPNMGSVVRYSSRDVLRLASAPRRER